MRRYFRIRQKLAFKTKNEIRKIRHFVEDARETLTAANVLSSLLRASVGRSRNSQGRVPKSTVPSMGVRTWGANGVSWKTDEKSENMQKRLVFYVYVISREQSGQAGEENGAMLTTYLFRHTSERTIS